MTEISKAQIEAAKRIKEMEDRDRARNQKKVVIPDCPCCGAKMDLKG